MAQAGAFMAIYAGALRPGDRLAHEDPDAHKCLHCQQAGHDEIHIFYLPQPYNPQASHVCNKHNMCLRVPKGTISGQHVVT
eukprot:10225729-Karenia_brevis.AAC.1